MASDSEELDGSLDVTIEDSRLDFLSLQEQGEVSDF